MKKKQIIFIISCILGAIPVLFISNVELMISYLRVLFLFIFIFTLYLYLANIEVTPPKYIIINYNLREMKYKGRKVYILSSLKSNNKNKYILYLHGGSYVMETTYKHWQFLGDLVNETDCTLILPDYPLSPKHTYKDVFNMIEPLYEDIIKKVGKENIILMGDSAGGGMALGLIEKLTIDKKDLPVKTILLSPWLDVRLKNEKIEKIEKLDPSLIKSALILAGRTYAGKDGMESYLVNPIDGPLKGIKNTYIFTGTYDILNPDVHIFMERARKENADIKLIEVEKAIHIWMTYRESNEEVYFANETFNDIVKLVKEEDENER